MMAVKNTNRDVGAKTLEINRVEYLVRGLGYIQSVEDLEKAVVAVNQNVPIRIKDIGRVSLGPANRRGLLDKDGAEVVGGVVVARYGANPLEVIRRVKEQIAQLAPGLPRKTLSDGTVSQVTVVPFYDRTGLIHETIGTLETALSHEILISMIVVIVLVLNLRASVLIASLLPVAVLMTFIIMRYAGVDANVVALSGIAIAIGVMVDASIVMVENVHKHIEKEPLTDENRWRVIADAATEVGPALFARRAPARDDGFDDFVLAFDERVPLFALQLALEPPEAQQDYAGEDGAGHQCDADEKECCDQDHQPEYEKHDALEQAGLRAVEDANAGVVLLIHGLAVSLNRSDRGRASAFNNPGCSF